MNTGQASNTGRGSDVTVLIEAGGFYSRKYDTAKTEILWSATGRRSHQLPQLPLPVGNDEVMPATVVRDLGIYIDADVSLRSHM